MLDRLLDKGDKNPVQFPWLELGFHLFTETTSKRMIWCQLVSTFMP